MAIEDFTTYTELDPGSQVAVTSPTITGTNVTRNLDTYVYADKGVNHFDGDFSHDLDITATNGTQQVMASWCLTNDIDDFKGLIDANKDFFALQHNLGVSYILREDRAGASYNDIATLTNGQIYYVTIARDESIGTFGTLYCYIYSDTGRTTLVDTLAVALHTSKLDLRYIFGLNSYNDANASTGNLVVSNLDLGEAIGIGQKIAGMFGLGRLGLR